jgi:hypothetical protein
MDYAVPWEQYPSMAFSTFSWLTSIPVIYVEKMKKTSSADFRRTLSVGTLEGILHAIHMSKSSAALSSVYMSMR